MLFDKYEIRIQASGDVVYWQLIIFRSSSSQINMKVILAFSNKSKKQNIGIPNQKKKENGVYTSRNKRNIEFPECQIWK